MRLILSFMVIPVSLAIGLMGCQSKDKKQTVQGASVSRKLPDLAADFKAEAAALQLLGYCLEKQGKFNKQQETGLVSSSQLDWSQELSAFIALDLNKTAWKDYLHGDTVLLSGGIKALRYMSQNPELEIDSILIHQNAAGELLDLKAWLDGTNELVDGKKILSARFELVPNQGRRLASYQMTFTQRVILQEPLTTQMVGRIVPPIQCK